MTRTPHRRFEFVSAYTSTGGGPIIPTGSGSTRGVGHIVDSRSMCSERLGHCKLSWHEHGNLVHRRQVREGLCYVIETDRLW